MSRSTPIAIAIVDGGVKLVHAKNVRSQVQISGVVSRRLANDSDAELLDALRDLAQYKGIKTAGVCLVLPRHLAILKVLRLPSQEDRELRQMVEIQISSQTPYNLEEVEYHYRPLSRDDEGYSQVLLTVVPKEVSNRYIELAGTAGIPLTSMTISSVGLLGWFQYQVSRNRLTATRPVALCVIQLNHTEICFVENEQLIFSRSINVGLKELRDNPGEMIRQLSLSMKYYQNEKMGGDVSRFVVVADQVDMGEFVAELEHTLQIPCELISTQDGVAIPGNAIRGQLEEDSGVTLTAAMGIQLTTGRQMINLLPDTIMVSKESKVWRRELLKLLVLVGCLYGLALFMWSLRISVKESEAQHLAGAITGLDPQIDDAKRKMKLIEFFDAYAQQRIFVPEIMRRLAQLIPGEISLRALYLNEKNVFTIQGYAETREALNDFQARLVNEEMFKNVNLEFATSRKIFNMQVTDFKFTCLISTEEG